MCDWKEVLLAIQLADLWHGWRPQIVFQLAVRENVLWSLFLFSTQIFQSFLFPPTMRKTFVWPFLKISRRRKDIYWHRIQSYTGVKHVLFYEIHKKVAETAQRCNCRRRRRHYRGMSILLRGARILKYNLACCKPLHWFQDMSTLKVRGLALLSSPRWQCVMVENWLGQRPTLIFHPENDDFFLWKGIRRLISWNSIVLKKFDCNFASSMDRLFFYLFSFLTWNFGKRFGRHIQFFLHFCLAMLIGNWCKPVFCFSTGPKNTNKIFPCPCLWQSFAFSLPFIACQWFSSNSALSTAHSRLCFVVRMLSFLVRFQIRQAYSHTCTGYIYM